MDETTIPLKKKDLLILLVAIVIIVLLSLMPAKWLGLGSNKLTQNVPGDLTVISTKIKNGENPIAPYIKSFSDNGQATDVSTVDPVVNDDNNITTQFSKNSFSIAAALNNQGVTDTNTVNKVGANLGNITQSDLFKPKFTINDVKISQNNDVKTLKDYGNKIVGETAIILVSLVGNKDTEDVSNYMNDKNISDLKNYDVKITYTQKVINDFKQLSVPPSFANAHLNMLNNLNSYLVMLKGFRGTDTDPLYSYIALNNYGNISNSFINSIREYKTIFDNNSIVFGPNDPGYLFNNLNYK